MVPTCWLFGIIKLLIMQQSNRGNTERQINVEAPMDVPAPQKKASLIGDISIILNHPQFRPLRMVFAIWVIATLILGGYWAYTLFSAQGASADTTVDDTQVEFDTGTYSYTQWDGVNNWIESTNTNNPIGVFPENAVSTGWIDMTNNTLLYHLDESSGALTDKSGQGNTGTAYNGVLYSLASKMNTAIKFDGINDYVDTGLNIDTYSTMTVSVWIKPHSLADNEYIFDTSNGTSGCGARVTATGGTQFFCYSGGGVAVATASSGLVVDTWYNLVFVMTPTKFKIYKDGVAFASVSHTNTAGIDDSGYTLKLGSEYSGTSGYSNLTLDEVAVWSRELSISEITEIYRKQGKSFSGLYDSNIKNVGSDSVWNSIAWSPSRPVGKEFPDNAGIETGYISGNADMTGSVGLWHLNDTSGSVIDTSGNSNNGTYSGSLYSQPGRLNTSIGFDGVNDEVDMGNISSTLFSSDFTVSTWIFHDSNNSDFIWSKGATAGANADLFVRAGSGYEFRINGTYGADADTGTGDLVNTWQNVVVTRSGTTLKIYIDGAEQASVTNSEDGSSTDSFIIGDAAHTPNVIPWEGDIDELAVYSRALTATEILDGYKRGSSKIKMQVRSCNDAACSGESFIGSDGTANTYYEWGTTNSISTPSFTLSGVIDNSYFQYKTFFETDDVLYTPELKSVTVDYTLANAPPDTPTNSTPTGGATLQVRNTALSTSVYNDGDGDAHTDTSWEVDDNSDFSSPEWARTAGSAEVSTTVNTTNGTFANSLSGLTELAANTTYYFRVRYNDGTAWSSWSTGTSYTTEGSITVTAPTTGTKWSVGETQNITWAYVGTPATTVTIKADSGDGSGFDYTVATGVSIGVAGVGSYSWSGIPSSEQGTATKVQVTSDQQSIQDDSDTYKVMGGLTVTAPNGSESWIALTPDKTISWTTVGSMSNVDILYSTDGGSTYPYTIASAVANSGTYATWTLPDLSSNTTVRVKVVDSADADSYDESDADFTIRDAAITVNVQNSSNSDHLSDVSFNPGDGTGAANKSSPFTYYWPYGSFDIIMDKVGYNTKTVTQSVTTDTTLNLTMTAQSVLNKTTAAVGFETDSDTLKINAWLELNGSVITSPSSAEVWLENNSGVVMYNATSSSPSAGGTFTFSQTPSGLPDEDVYQAKVRITNDGTNYVSTTPVGLLKRVKNFANAAVYIDTSSAYTGTAYPKGNQEHPVSNITDALTIAAANSLTHLYVRGTVTVPGGLSLANYAFSGHSANSGAIVLGGGSTVGTSLDNLTVSGTVNGDIVIRDSFINGLTAFSGVIYNSALTASTITLAGSSGTTVNILDSRSSVAGTGTPTIDFGGAGRNLSVRGYSGGLAIVNKTGAGDSISMDFLSGHAKIESSCTAGDIVVRGIVKITDNSAGCNVISYGAVTAASVADAVLDEQLSDHTVVGSLGANQANVITELNANEAKIDIVDTVVDAISVTTTDTNTKVTDIQSTVNTISALLTSVDNKIDTLQASVAALRTSQQGLYNIELSSESAVQVGNTYRVKLNIEDYESDPVDATSTPTITIYDAARTIVVPAVTTMTSIETGVYEYTYAIPSGATSGLYETVVAVPVGGDTIKRVSYWQATGAPSQVIINSISDLTIDSVAASVTISNEGNASYEYQYEWCVVTTQDNKCGGGDDVYYGSAAKLVTPGIDFNTTLTATVPDVGDYWFKVVNYYGTESSSASRSFTAITETAAPASSGGAANGPVVGSGTATINQLQLTSNQLLEALDGAKTINIEVSGLSDLLEINERQTETLKDVQNKLAQLQAVSDTINAVVSNNSTEPIVQSFMQFNSVELHFLITNPSSEAQTVKFRAALPKEAAPEDIMNANGLEVEYDTNAQSYFVSADITLQGGESITKKVELTDIWLFDTDDLKIMKSQAKSYSEVLDGTQYEAQGALLLAELDGLATKVGQSQATSYDTPQNHIVVYRDNVTRMQTANVALDKLKDLVTSSGVSNGLVGSIGGIQTFSTWGIVLAMVFGFGLLAAIIFAMWRQQTLLISALGRHGKGIPGLNYPEPQIEPINEPAQEVGAADTQQDFVHEHLIEHDPETFWGRIVHMVKVLSGSVLGVLILISFPGFIIGLLMLTVPQYLMSSATVSVPGVGGSNPSVYIKKTDTPALNEDTKGASANFETFNKSTSAVSPLVSDSEQVQTGTDSITKDSPEEVTDTEGEGRLLITDTPTGYLNVRAKPATSYTKLGKVSVGSEYTFEAQKAGWYYIIVPKGIDGWVSGEYVELLK